MGKRMVEAAGKGVGRGQITQGLSSHSKEVSFIQSATGGQREFIQVFFVCFLFFK